MAILVNATYPMIAIIVVALKTGLPINCNYRCNNPQFMILTSGRMRLHPLISDMDVEDFLSGQGLDNASVGERYVTSIYFVSAVITTVGFGDVTGSNTWERLYCVVIMFIGSVIFGTLLANISDIAMMLDDSSAERSMMSEMVKWARQKKVSACNYLKEKCNMRARAHTHTHTGLSYTVTRPRVHM